MHYTSSHLDTIKYSTFYFFLIILVENLVLSPDSINITQWLGNTRVSLDVLRLVYTQALRCYK